MGTVLAFTPPPRQVTASIRCLDCPWAAVQTGDNAIDVSVFLHQLYRRHLADRHPDLTLSEVPS